MRAWEIENIKSFMTKLLKGNSFDLFLLEKADIFSSMKMHFDGHYYDGYFQNDNLSERKKHGNCIPYVEVKHIFFEAIKGDKVPLHFLFVLKASDEVVESICTMSDVNKEAVNGMFLNLSYKEKRLLVTAGISMKTFTQNKAVEDIWCDKIENFLKKSGFTWSYSLK